MEKVNVSASGKLQRRPRSLTMGALPLDSAGGSAPMQTPVIGSRKALAMARP